MAKFHSGKYFVENKKKYEGDFDNVMYRSSWEKQAFKWCDLNPDVVSWNSEEVVIPYRCKTDGRVHRYFMDLKITFKSGKTLLVEIKPKAQTVMPKKKSNKKKLMEEVMTYAKNRSKWDAAKFYAERNGWDFQVWTEDTLASIGIQTKVGGKIFPKKKPGPARQK